MISEDICRKVKQDMLTLMVSYEQQMELLNMYT